MKHLGTKTLESDRLLLRRFRIEDAPAMFNNWANDPQVTKYLMWPCHESVAVSKAVLSDWTGHYEEDDFYQWAIVLKENGDEPVGGISVVDRHEHIDMLQIGYCIGQNWWHQGIMSEALGLLIRFFFEEVGVNRVEAKHDPRNIHSGQVMLKCGMKHEGTMRQADHNNQGLCDAAMYAILAEDYFAAQGHNHG